ncbi:MAG: glutathione S-transferase family protein [Pseudomonadota bacterium]
MFEVIGSRASRAFRVLWMLEELGLEYTHHPVAPRSEKVMAANPSGKIPVLMVHETALTDSVAIMTFLADKHAALTFPAGSTERALQDGLTQQINDEIDAVLWMAAKHSFIFPEKHRVPEIKTTLMWEYERSIGRISDKLQGPFLMGQSMTIPDIVLCHCLRWAEMAKFPNSSEKINAYRSALEARPAFTKTVELP